MKRFIAKWKRRTRRELRGLGLVGTGSEMASVFGKV